MASLVNGCTAWSFARRAPFQPVFPARNELEKPEAPVADEDLCETFTLDEISAVDG